MPKRDYAVLTWPKPRNRIKAKKTLYGHHQGRKSVAPKVHSDGNFIEELTTE